MTGRMIAVFIILGLQLVGLGVALAKHGKEESSKSNFGTTFVSTLILWALYWWAGLFDVFKRSE